MLPVLAMLLAAMLWASSMVGAKVAVADLAIAEVVSGRFLFAAALLWAMVLLSRQPVRLGQAKRPLLMGMLDPGLVSLLIVWALQHTSAVNASVFWALMPLIMPIAGRLVLKETINPIVVAGALLAVTGAVMLVAVNQAAGEGSLFGDLLAVSGVLCAVASSLLARRVAQQQGRAMVTTAWQMTMALMVGGVALMVLEQPGETVERVGQGPLLLMLYLGMFATAGPFFLFNFAMRHLPVGRISLFASLVGPLSVPMAALFLGETIQGLEIAAIAVVMLGVFLPTLIGPERLALFRRPIRSRPRGG
jgi:drug/metabolite transporter (DMT)-like permease